MEPQNISAKCLDTIELKCETFIGTPVLCVFGVLANQRGFEIKDEMMSWLPNHYDVITVQQKYPGKLFEYPALCFAQMVSEHFNKPVLYVHTKGAFNTNKEYLQNNVRELWKYEFNDHYEWYLDKMTSSDKAVACPFIGDKLYTTWMNGFMVAPGAFRSISQIKPSTNRFPYEHLFRYAKIDAFGRILTNVNRYPQDADKMVSIINNKLFNNY